MRNLEENAGAVAGLGIASAGTSVRQVEQHLDSLTDDVVTFVAAHVGHKSDATGVMLLRRMVETLSGRTEHSYLVRRVVISSLCIYSGTCAGIAGRFGISCS